MTSLFKAVVTWWTTHSGWTSFIYFVLALWASLFTDRAKRVIFAPVRFPIRRAALWMERDLDNTINVVKYMHTDTFHLVHYLAYYLLHSFFYAVRWTIITSIIMYSLYFFVFHQSSTSMPVLPLSLFFGGFTARLMRLQLALGYLFNYEKSIAELEALRTKYPPIK